MFPLFHNVFNISLASKSQIAYSFVKCGCSIYFVSQFCKSDMSRYGSLEEFQRVPLTSRYRESTVCIAYSFGRWKYACKNCI